MREAGSIVAPFPGISLFARRDWGKTCATQYTRCRPIEYKWYVLKRRFSRRFLWSGPHHKATAERLSHWNQTVKAVMLKNKGTFVFRSFPLSKRTLLCRNDSRCGRLFFYYKWLWSVAYRGGFEGVQTPPPPRNSEVLTKLSRIPSSVENTSVTT